MGGRTRVLHDLCGTPEYEIWIQMVRRCHRNKPDSKTWAGYQGRGISVCDRWRYSVANFYADMGPRPEGMTLERKDNDGNYEPDNCKWATRKEQANNHRYHRLLTLGDKTMNLTQWSEATGISHATLYYRLSRGWTVARVLITPIMASKRRSKSKA